MPLSDHEQRLLEEMERALYQEDPKFAFSLLSGRSEGIDRTKLALGSLGVVLGLVVVVVAVAVTVPLVGVLGFALMVAGAFWAWLGVRGQAAAAVPSGDPLGDSSMPAAAASKPKGGQSALMSKMEERWRKRREGNGQF